MEQLTDLEIKHNQKEILWLLENTKRKGMDKVIDFLIKNDFFTLTPVKTRHHQYRGGLAQHSLGVFHQSLKFHDNIHSEESLIIVCLLHDICKIDNVFPDCHGHGNRSADMIKAIGLELTAQEETAIRNHMHHDPNSNNSLQAVVHLADKNDVAEFKRLRK